MFKLTPEMIKSGEAFTCSTIHRGLVESLLLDLEEVTVSEKYKGKMNGSDNMMVCAHFLGAIFLDQPSDLRDMSSEIVKSLAAKIAALTAAQRRMDASSPEAQAKAAAAAKAAMDKIFNPKPEGG